ncbi:hypothetical protein ACSQ67_010813 [Phaseolus vulgaris]
MSSPGNKTTYKDAAIELGRELVSRNIDLVYGGGSIGLMGLISQAVYEGGRHSYSQDTYAKRGGYGTLEELLEVITWAQLGIHDKPVGLLNVDGYYNTFLSFIDKAVEEGFISPTARHIIVSAPTPKELVKEMEEYFPQHERVVSKCLYLLLYDYSQQIIDRVLFVRSVSNKKASFNPSVSTIDSISLLSSPVGNSFDVPVAESEIDRFSAEVERSPAVIDSSSGTKNLEVLGSIKLPKIFVASNPRGAESLPPGIVVSESDFYLRRLWGEPSELYSCMRPLHVSVSGGLHVDKPDLKKKPKYLVTFTVGLEQRHNINAAVKKFSDDFAILLFHYDGRTSEWDQFEWSKKAIHVSARKQTKWWYAKRFLHPDIVSAYEYIFIWDEDLGVEHFNADKYIHLVKKYGLEISQPGLEPNKGLTWEMTKRRGDKEVHMVTEEKPGWCSDPHLPPCAAFVEIMAPVFSREAWRCVWHMIQNDLVHGWGLDFALRRCVEPAHEKIGVIDSQWIVHQVIPSLGNQATNALFGESDKGKKPWDSVRARCKSEWAQFQVRLTNSDKAYLEGLKRNGKS